ncbi:MAG: hypothetical protein DMG67_17130, partial [Acidobacteria bacterium]
HQQQRDRAATAAAVAISGARAASSFMPTRPTELPQPQRTTPEAGVQSQSPGQPSSQLNVPAKNTFAPALQRTPSAPARETPSLDQVKSNVTSSFPQDDLDVPAFIRKRGDQ